MLHTAVARSLTSGVAIRYVLPGVDDVMPSHSGQV